MTQGEERRVDDAHAYDVVTGDGSSEKIERSKISHAGAMRLAEELRLGGKVARVMHVVGDRSYEVDRYPAR